MITIQKRTSRTKTKISSSLFCRRL